MLKLKESVKEQNLLDIGFELDFETANNKYYVIKEDYNYEGDEEKYIEVEIFVDYKDRDKIIKTSSATDFDICFPNILLTMFEKDMIEKGE